MGVFQDLKSKFSHEDEEDSGELDLDGAELNFSLSTDKDVKITDKVEKVSDIDVKYPLIQPFAYAHVKWDPENKEVIYHLEEPELTEDDLEALTMIKENLSEKLDVSLSGMKNRENVIKYLEKKIDELLKELGIIMNEKQHNKIMYYIYRDFVGLGKIEPFMHDPYIEDLGCDGTDVPIFAVHSEFGSVKSGVRFEEEEPLKNLVIKLAERCGKYVSYANPLLDGALPDGSRVNASLTEDVTAHGPTFSIRKFQETPFSAINMMKLGTADAQLMAYMWIIEQYQQSYLICGGTATGKTSFLNSTVSFIPPEDKIVSIEDSVTGDTEIEIKRNGLFERKTISDIVDPLMDELGEETVEGAERVDLEDSEIKVPTINQELNLDYVEPSSLIRHKVEKDIYRVKTATGREIKVTGDHSLFGLSGKELSELKPCNMDEGEFIATPRKLASGEGVDSVDILKSARDLERLFVEGDALETMFDNLPFRKIETSSDISESGYKYWKRNQMLRGREFQEFRSEINSNQDLTVRTKSAETYFPMQLPITDEFIELIGLWTGDGSFDYRNENCILITTSEKEIVEKVEKVAEQYDVNISKKNDGTLSINSVLLYELLRGLGFEGKSATKTLPDFCRNFSEDQIGKLLKGYFSADGCVKSYEVTCSSQSRELLENIQEMLLKLGIISSIHDYEREDDCMELSISSQKSVKKYSEKVGFIQDRKNNAVQDILSRENAHHEKKDVVPTDEILSEEIHNTQNIQWNYRNGINNIGRKYLKEIASDDSELARLAFSDVFWDKVVEIEKIETSRKYVYDISVPGVERFIAEKILAHNTRELQLPHENWIPSITRSMFGTDSNSDVDMDQLLKESFRENPDYVIVGEVRGEEASVLFQGMSSGHPSIGTMHASGPNDVVKRLVTPPINLSPALVESLDVVVAMTHAKGVEKSARRVREVHEIQKVMSESQSARTNEIFSWTARDDSFRMKGEPYLFDEISEDFGVSKKELKKEMEDRTNVLKWLREKGVTEFHRVSEIISEYYKNKEDIMKMVHSENEEYDLDDVINAESRIDIQRNDQLDSEIEKNKTEELESEIKNLDSNSSLEEKKKIEENPVEELEQKLRAETEDIDADKDEEGQKESPFENHKHVDDNPFEA